MRPRPGIIVVSLLAAVLSGCAASPDPVPMSPVFGSDRTAAGPLEAALVVPAGATAVPGQAGFEAGAHAMSRRREPGADPGTWTVAERDERNGRDLLVDRFRREPDGSVVLVESVNHRDSVLTRYEPPLVLLPGTLRPGQAFEQSITLRVHPLQRPEELQDEGPATNTITFEAVQPVALAGGVVDAARVRSVFRADLRAARVRSETLAWWGLEGEGLVAQRVHETARFMGLSVRDTTREWVARSAPGRGGPARGGRGSGEW